MTAVRLTQLDGKLPNMALMKLSAFHRARGDEIHFTRSPYRGMDEPDYGHVYGSAIFQFSSERVATFQREFPEAIIGGTGSASTATVESITHQTRDDFDYSIYPAFDGSLGFTQRGCRLKCKFCVVPTKEGPPRANSRIYEIWRGDGFPKHLHLLDNDFFGQPEHEWRRHIADIREGGFKVCLNQGINARMIDDAAAEALASIDYRDDGFKIKRLYTAWDNIGDEARFLSGVETLRRHGIPPTHLLVYMLIGYDKRETWERLFHRFNRMVDLGIRPYPMVFGDRHRTLPLGGSNLRIAHRTLSEFQRYVIRKAYTFVPFADYDVNAKGRPDKRQISLFEAAE